MSGNFGHATAYGRFPISELKTYNVCTAHSIRRAFAGVSFCLLRLPQIRFPKPTAGAAVGRGRERRARDRETEGRAGDAFGEASPRPDGEICAPLLLNRWRGNPNRFAYPCRWRQDAPRRIVPSVTKRTPRRTHQSAQATSDGLGATSTKRPRVRSWKRTHLGDQ